MVLWEAQVGVGRTGRAGEEEVGGSVWGGGAAAGDAWGSIWKRLWAGRAGGSWRLVVFRKVRLWEAHVAGLGVSGAWISEPGLS